MPPGEDAKYPGRGRREREASATLFSIGSVSPCLGWLYGWVGAFLVIHQNKNVWDPKHLDAVCMLRTAENVPKTTVQIRV